MFSFIVKVSLSSFSGILRKSLRSQNSLNLLRNMSSLRENIVFMDLEMTGLEITKNKILEIGCIITDPDLKQIADPFHVVINYPTEVLDNMNDWCKENLKELRLECQKSKISEQQAQEMLLAYLKKHVKEKTCPLAGNSIWMDRAFLRHHFPNVENYFHYRIIDVSSIKELCKRWNPKLFYQTPQKKLNHRAIDDIEETILELKFYQENFLICK